ncbi:SDR family oxidoreductase [Corticibacterium sp. UT-5YL-CI-8]|nr:SDR family oxidoreductase [Tianweitania sp. UT-5YL-CI-8]
MSRNKSKVMLITGAASGIGAATARQATEAGYKVIIADINEAGANAAAASIGPAGSAKRLDICSPANWETVLDEIFAEHGHLDVLINNAATVHTGFARDVPIAKHQHTMDTNFMGAATGMLAALARFKAQGFGHITTICSMNGFMPFPGLASYAAAKHALRAFHHAVAIEERNSPVIFTIVYPTATETPMLEKEAEDDAMALAFAGNSVTPDHVAAIILKAIKRKSLEAYIPAERGKFVRRIGVNPRGLKALFERNEIIGAERLKARRAATAQAKK